ncbi:hypothetical protein JOM56_014701 [Amanita muscaria]
MSTTRTLASPETVAIRAANAFFLAGLVLDVLAALLAFLTTRWFERLTEEERTYLEAIFSQKQNNPAKRRWKMGSSQWFFYTWLGMSLFVPMPLLILGIVCMMVGIYTYVWTQLSVIVASLVTLAGAGPLPFIFGDFFIGGEPARRRNLIIRLSEMQGDW